MTGGPVAVLDHTALMSIFRSRVLSRLLAAAHKHEDTLLYVPTICLLEASIDNATAFGHVVTLPAVRIADLPVNLVRGIARLARGGYSWPVAHAYLTAAELHAVRGPDGGKVVIVTADRTMYHGLAAQMLELPDFLS